MDVIREPLPVAPPARAPEYGLLVAVPVVNDPTLRWEGGTTWQPEGCGGGGRVGLDDCYNELDSPTPDGQPANGVADPFIVWATDRCSIMGGRTRDWQGRALRQLEAVQSYEIAAELWTGSLGLASPSLTGPTAAWITSSATSAGAALACLETALGDCGKGRRGLIHVTRKVLDLLRQAQAIDFRNGVWQTVVGNIVVCDAGYDGSWPDWVDEPSPTPGQDAMYATSFLQVRLGKPEILPASLDGAAIAGYLTSDNTLTVWARRPVLWEWDACCHFGIPVDVPTCSIETIGS